MTNNVQQIGAEFLHFGPKLMRTTITEEFRKELYRRGELTVQSYENQLAGHVKKENRFTNSDDLKYFEMMTEPYFTSYIDDYNKYMGLTCESFSLVSLWINWMEPGDFNPPHIHFGDLSFVLYVDVPEEIHEENKKYVGTHNGPGCIDFIQQFERDDFFSRGAYTFVPKSGDFFIFPALLPHMVAPYKSNVKRVSIAGNVTLKNKQLPEHRLKSPYDSI
jgi:hypothetical protein